MKAKETFREAIKLYDQTGIELEYVDKLCSYIDLLLESNTLVEAEKYLKKCEELTTKHASLMDQIKLMLRQGMYYKVIGDVLRAKSYFTEARTMSETIDQYKDTIRASIYLAELELERTHSKGLEREAIKQAFANVEKAYYLSERTSLFPNMVRTLIIKGSLLGAQLEFIEALRTLEEAIRICVEKEFRQLYRQAKELAERLKQRQEFIRPHGVLGWEELGMSEVLAYIRLMTGRQPNLPANAGQLETFYLSSFLFEVNTSNLLFFDPLPKEAVMPDRPFDPIIIGMFFSGVLGGNRYNQGLFGPIPTPDLIDFHALVYTKQLEPATNENPTGSFCMTVLAYPKLFDPLYYNRFEFEKIFNDHFQNLRKYEIKKQLDPKFFESLKSALKESIQKQIAERTKSW
jgi:tetratricopeptide (TPR) repeat protein